MALFGGGNNGQMVGYGQTHQASSDVTVINNSGEIYVNFKIPCFSNASSVMPNATLTAAQSGAVIHVTPTNALSITLPVGVPGIHYKILIADKINKAFTIKTAGAGSDNNDSFQMRCQTLADDGATMDVDGDTLTFTNALEGSWIDLLCVTGGANELWHAAVFGTDTVAATVADS